MKSKLLNITLLAATLSLLGCTRSDVLAIDGAAELLEAPYPMNYPSSSPKPNRVLQVIRDQEVQILREHADKDFLVYEVRARDGAEGFIIASSKVHKKPQTSP